MFPTIIFVSIDGYSKYLIDFLSVKAACTLRIPLLSAKKQLILFYDANNIIKSGCIYISQTD